jgi:GTP-dependent phosphoenolpyruvate carboxykinase
MASQKAIENSKRLRYIRALERFHKSIISYLSNTQDLTKEGYVKKIDNALKLLNRVDEVMIYKGELKDLQELVKKMILLKESEDDVDDIKEEILHASNQLDKSKNARKYKKDKHQKSKFQEWD